MKDNQESDKILGFTSLHKIEVSHPYTNFKIRSQKF